MNVGLRAVTSQPLTDLGAGVRVHPTAEIDPSVDLGAGTVVWAHAVVLGGVTTGPHCAIGSGVYVGRDTVLGESVRVQDKAHLTDRMRCGARVFVGPCATFVNDRHPRVNNPSYHAEPPVVEDDVSVGANATILPGVVLGRGCVIGAGAVVTRSVPPGETWVGNPARRLRHGAAVDEGLA